MTVSNRALELMDTSDSNAWYVEYACMHFFFIFKSQKQMGVFVSLRRRLATV